LSYFEGQFNPKICTEYHSCITFKNNYISGTVDVRNLFFCHALVMFLSLNFTGSDKMFQHGTTQPPFTPIPILYLFKQNVQKAINFI